MYLIAEEDSGTRAVKRLTVDTLVEAENGQLSLSTDGVLSLLSVL